MQTVNMKMTLKDGVLVKDELGKNVKLRIHNKPTPQGIVTAKIAGTDIVLFEELRSRIRTRCKSGNSSGAAQRNNRASRQKTKRFRRSSAEAFFACFVCAPSCGARHPERRKITGPVCRRPC